MVNLPWRRRIAAVALPELKRERRGLLKRFLFYATLGIVMSGRR